MDIKITLHTMDDPLCIVPAIVDMECCSNQFIIGICYLAVLFRYRSLSLQMIL